MLRDRISFVRYAALLALAKAPRLIEARRADIERLSVDDSDEKVRDAAASALAALDERSPSLAGP